MSWFVHHPRATLAVIVLLGMWSIDFGLALAFPRANQGHRVPHAVYHHDLRPNVRTVDHWGPRENLLVTNSLGFKDESRREVALDSDRYRVMFLGDSFTEGRGVSWEYTFAGRIADALDGEVEVLNAAVASYSPKLYYLKAEYLLEEIGLDVDEMAVFIDISDPQDEWLYRDLQNPLALRLRKLLLDHSIVGRTALSGGAGGMWADLADDPGLPWTGFRAFFSERSRWTHDVEIFERWGREGLKLAADNMDRLVDLCRAYDVRLSIAVYPWPEQIAAGDPDSPQVRFWRRFARRRDVEFLDYFEVFMGGSLEPAKVIDAYFIEDDVHWNRIGHRRVARHWLHAFCDHFESSHCEEPDAGASPGPG